jgi:glucokinase
VAVGIDLGGTKIAAGLVGDDGTVTERITVPTTASLGPASVVTDLIKIISNLQDRARRQGVEVKGIGVASAGAVDPERGVLVAVTDALPGFESFPLRRELERLALANIAVLNDVHAMALGEQHFGVGRRAKDVLYVAVGTGVGGAMTRSGALVLGAHGFAGDIGHVLIDSSPSARRCPCGRNGHLEAYVSGPALASEYHRQGGKVGLEGDLRPVAERAGYGDTQAKDILREGGQLLGRTIGGIVNLLNPELVVFGGGLLDLTDGLFWDHVADRLRKEVRVSVAPRVERAQLGGDAAIVGAAVAGRANLGAFLYGPTQGDQQGFPSLANSRPASIT